MQKKRKEGKKKKKKKKKENRAEYARGEKKEVEGREAAREVA